MSMTRAFARIVEHARSTSLFVRLRAIYAWGSRHLDALRTKAHHAARRTMRPAMIVGPTVARLGETSSNHRNNMYHLVQIVRDCIFNTDSSALIGRLATSNFQHTRAVA